LRCSGGQGGDKGEYPANIGGVSKIKRGNIQPTSEVQVKIGDRIQPTAEMEVKVRDNMQPPLHGKRGRKTI
jgi:hypothetical protein